MIVRVRIRVARDFGDGIKGAIRRGVVTQDAVPFAHLLQGADGLRFGACTMPHFLPFNEERVPVIVMRVGAEDPISSLLRWWNRHRGFERTIHTAASNAKQNVRLSSTQQAQAY